MLIKGSYEQAQPVKHLEEITENASWLSWFYRPLEYLKSLYSSDSVKSPLNYPIKPNRFFRFGWNQNYQSCYNQEDIKLLEKIATKYKLVAEDGSLQKFFGLTEESQWWDWWKCKKPVFFVNNVDHSHTMPTRPVKDEILFSFSENMARKIGNWQSERAKNQNLELMNEPATLVFEELKDWFYHHLAHAECSLENKEYITQRQNYLKNIVYYIPDFGADKLHLLEVQNKLGEASQIILQCVASKQLPQLLSDIITKTKTLETTIATYLHFLLSNERVSDNFSEEFLTGEADDCDASPICKIYRDAKSLSTVTSSDGVLTKFQEVNSLYHFFKTAESEQTLHVGMQLKTNLLSKLKFPNFISSEDKLAYLETLAALDSLIRIRKTLEDYKQIQLIVGIYIFAFHYIIQTNALSENFNALINKSQTLTERLIKTSNAGQRAIYSNSELSKQYQDFQTNLRALNLDVTKETTINNQLEQNCILAKSSMLAYQSEMKKLVAQINSGFIEGHVKNSMQNLMEKISTLNKILPAQLTDKKFVIDKQENALLVDCTTQSTALRADPSNLPPQVFAEDICDITDQTINNDVENKIFKNPEQVELLLKEIYDQQLKSNFYNKIWSSIKDSAIHGFLRGGSNVVTHALQKTGMPEKKAYFRGQLIYGISLFMLNFMYSYQKTPALDTISDLLNTSLEAAFETGQILLLSNTINFISSLFHKAGNKCETKSWNKVGKSLKVCGRLTHFGFFAYHAAESGVLTTVAALGTGAATESLTEYAGNNLITLATLGKNPLNPTFSRGK